MKKKLFDKSISGFLTFILVIAFIYSFPTKAYTSDYVQTTSFYTYTEMYEDIALLCQTYPQFVSQSTIGSSVCGRDIPMVILGNEAAPHKVFIQSNIHACEYQCAPIAMKLIEYYASQYSQGNLLEVYSKTCFYIVPMVNPDGVCIAQFGADSVTNDYLKLFIQTQGTKTLSWKANADGVDLNRNWNAGWELGNSKVTLPSYANWKGMAPETEPELIAVRNASVSQNFDCYVNFHQRGNVIYCGSNLANPVVNALSSQLASVIKSVNGYTIYGPSGSGSGVYGSYADYICSVLGKPSCTIEFGSRLPSVNNADCTKIINKNLNLFKAISDAL